MRRRDRRARPRGVERAAPRRDQFVAQRGDRLAPLVDVVALHPLAQALAQQRQRAAGRAGDQQIGLEIAERILGLQRIGREVDDLGVAARRYRLRHPRHRASSTSTTSARGNSALTSKPRFIGWLDGRLRSFGSPCTTGSANSSVSAANAAKASGERPSEDVRISGNCAPASRCRRRVDRLRDGTAAMAPSGRSPSRRVGVAASASTSRGKREIDRAARLAHGDVERAVDDRRDRLAGAQFVIPFDEFAHHAALVERFLAPMDRPVARG